MALKWGILGAGNISGQFVADLLTDIAEGNNTHVVAAVGSSLRDKGEEFIKKLGISADSNQGTTPQSLTYAELYSSNVDVIYVGTPHSFHKEQVLAAIEHNKHVVCEKPFTVTAAEAREVFEKAKLKNVLVMEAVWTRFFPAVEKAKKLIFSEKSLGDVHRLTADFSMNADIGLLPKSSRARDITLAAGATLDIGIYPITYGRIFLDEEYGDLSKFSVQSFLTLDPVDGVDHNSTILLRYKDGKQAVLTSSNYTDGPSPFLRLEGTKGILTMSSGNPAQPKNYTVTFTDGSPDISFEDSGPYIGFIHEANAAAAAIAAGQKECLLIPWKETLLTMGLMDEVRWKDGLYYPGEKH